jgi:hypothetical protein
MPLKSAVETALLISRRWRETGSNKNTPVTVLAFVLSKNLEGDCAKLLSHPGQQNENFAPAYSTTFEFCATGLPITGHVTCCACPKRTAEIAIVVSIVKPMISELFLTTIMQVPIELSKLAQELWGGARPQQSRCRPDFGGPEPGLAMPLVTIVSLSK